MARRIDKMKVAVIGAGAAGLMSAYAAAKNGNHVTVFEKNEKCGKKIYITGKGRCNFTNDVPPEEFINNVVNNPKFLLSSIYAFSPEKCIGFFEDGGMPAKVERGNRAFPVSDKASDVTRCLENYCKSVGVEFKFGTEILKIERLNSTMFDIIAKNDRCSADKVIICTGGLSYPSTGSTGDGYKFAESFGHKIIKPVAALCGLNLAGIYYREMQGLSLKNIRLTAYENKRVVVSQFGEMLFTHFGISGPTVLSVSSYINRLNLKQIRLSLDFKPALSEEQLDKRLLRDFDEFSTKSVFNCLKNLLPVSVIPEVLRRSKIQPDKKVCTVTKAERAALLTTVKNFDMIVTSLRDFSEAIITSGGVNVAEINPKTMESKLVKGLYFCGEVLDVDALTGGFNLQIAFSTGFAAGNSIS